MVKNIVDENITRTFKLLRDCDWGITHTTDGVVTLVCHTHRFGNPDDVMWDLIVQSNLPVYCNYCNTDADKPWDMFCQLWDLRIWDLNEIRWGFDYGDDRELGLVIPDATDYIIKHPNVICIPLFSVDMIKNGPDKQPTSIYLCEETSISANDAAEYIINKVSHVHPDEVPTLFMRTVMEYYRRQLK